MVSRVLPDVLPDFGEPAVIEMSRDRMEAHLVYSSQRVTRNLGGEPLLIAKGSEPVHGAEARVEFPSISNRPTGKPTETFDGRVDFYNLNLIHNVDEGEVIAVKIPPGEGIPGYNVTGAELPARPGKDVQLVAGKNVVLVPGNETGFSEGTITAVSTVKGHVTVAGNKIGVSTVYEVQGDVDLNTGNIEFKGTVLINGSIREGFRVTAEGDVIVMNTVSDGIIECSGNLKVINGIVGTRCRIKAAGSVEARFIENSTVESGDCVSHHVNNVAPGPRQGPGR